MFEWLFKNKKSESSEILEVKEKPKKYQTVKMLKYSQETTQFNVGRTAIEASLSDGRKFRFVVYGTVEQHTWRESTNYSSLAPRWTDAKIEEPRITPSLDIATNFLTNYNSEMPITLIDAPYPDATESVSGKVIGMKIGKTEGHFVDYIVAHTVDEEKDITGM